MGLSSYPMLTTFKKRDITPTNYRYPFEKDPKGEFEEAFAEYLGECAEFETASKQSVYETKEIVSDISFRVHCGWMALLISSAQGLIFQYSSLRSEHPDLDLQFQVLQKKTDEYIVRLYDWHGAPGTHSDEPATFKAAMDEVQEGSIEEFQLD
jgi:hypothetical protein